MMRFAASLALLQAAQAQSYFSYDPEHEFGPASWAAVDMPGNECGGEQQSGIDIPSSDCASTENYIFSAGSCTIDDLEFILFPHAIQANYKPNACEPPRIRIPGEPLPFDAVQFHLHTGTDHAIDGVYFGADMHLVHKERGDGGRFAVLGFFIEPTNPASLQKFSDLLAEWEAVEAAVYSSCNIDTSVSILGAGGRRRKRQLLESMKPSKSGVAVAEEQSQRKLPRSFNPYELIPNGSSIYTYDGSLTTPPCSEVVFWNVVDIPVSVSVREFLRLTNLILDYVDPVTCEYATNAAPSGFTGRPVQNINGREITRFCPANLGSGELGAGGEDPNAPPEDDDEAPEADTEQPASSASASTVTSSLVLAIIAALTL